MYSFDIFPKNARVCFIGDSITHGHTFVAHIAAYYNEHLPDRNINFYNTGISGASVRTALDVFDIDITPTAPTHAVIMLGVNDSGRDLLSDGCTPEAFAQLRRNFEGYKDNMAQLCKRLANIGADIILCTPVPIDEYGSHPTATLPGGYALMLSYAEFVRAYAKEHGYAVCDYFAYITEMCISETLYREDRIHPTPRGHYHMAKCFLASQGLELGEEAPIPAYMEDWCRNVGIHRNLRAAEYMLIRSYTLSPKESIARINDLLAGGTLNEYFTNLSRCYVENKLREDEIRDAMYQATAQNFKKIENPS